MARTRCLRPVVFLSLLLLLSAVGIMQAGQAAFLVDDFQKSSSLSNWQFSNGAEFPGAAGSISHGQGHWGAGARLNFRIRCNSEAQTCGHYVAAYRAVSAPRDSEFHALSLWVSFPPQMKLVVRIEDETGQTLQYTANAPALEHQALNDWTPIIISLDAAPDCYWGGLANGRLNGAITQVGIIADSKNAVPTSGQAGFDDVWLLASPVTEFDLTANTPVLPLPAASVPLTDRLGVNIHSLDDEVGFDAARSAGFSFVRTDLTWAAVEKNGQYDFSSYDCVLASLEARGMGVLWILDYGHPDHGGSQPRSAADVAAYARYAQAAARHFKGHNVRYEIWNEPNVKSFLPDPSIYPKLLNSAATAIRETDASAILSTGGLSGIDVGFLNNSALNAPARKANAIAIHPYRTAAPETLAGDLMLLRQMVDTKFRRGMPIWDTEWGYSSCGFFSQATYGDGDSDLALKRQAVLAVRRLLTVWTLGLPVAVWYDLRDDRGDPADPESNFGLLDQNNNDKPAMRAVRMLTGVAAEATLAGLAADSPAGVHVLKLESGTDVSFIVWCDAPGGSSQVRLSTEELESATDMLGGSVPAIQSANETAVITFAETDGPVYLKFRRPPMQVARNPSSASRASRSEF